MINLLLPKFWRKRGMVSYLLLPLSLAYRLFIYFRRLYYKYVTTVYFPIPIIVVGNITVGGTGKTPLVIYLANLLKQQGYNPGIISRGYGRKNPRRSLTVTAVSKVEDVGDEALLIARKVPCPIIVNCNRVAGAKALLLTHQCDVIISDDGLQHYQLPRYLEIAVVDAEFGSGNRFCLPSGPLREPISRLQQVAFVVKNFNTADVSESATLGVGAYSMVLEPVNFRQIKDPKRQRTANDFKDQIIHAVAGIGRPGKFFQTLRQLGLKIIEHPFPDHYSFSANDLLFADGAAVIMTEKDAVKCDKIPDENLWYMEIRAKLSNNLARDLLESLKKYPDFHNKS